jgi:hypothetical protein
MAPLLFKAIVAVNRQDPKQDIAQHDAALPDN